MFDLKFEDMVYKDENYYYFMLSTAFEMLKEPFDYVELVDYNNKLMGRITIFDMFFLICDEDLVLIKDADIFDYRLDNINIPYEIIPLNKVHYLNFAKQ